MSEEAMVLLEMLREEVAELKLSFVGDLQIRGKAYPKVINLTQATEILRKDRTVAEGMIRVLKAKYPDLALLPESNNQPWRIDRNILMNISLPDREWAIQQSRKLKNVALRQVRRGVAK